MGSPLARQSGHVLEVFRHPVRHSSCHVPEQETQVKVGAYKSTKQIEQMKFPLSTINRKYTHKTIQLNFKFLKAERKNVR